MEKKSSFFGDEKGEFTINKANVPENALIYINQGSIFTLKTGDAIYLDYVISGQLICAKNLSEECKQMRLSCTCLFTMLIEES